MDENTYEDLSDAFDKGNYGFLDGKGNEILKYSYLLGEILLHLNAQNLCNVFLVGDVRNALDLGLETLYQRMDGTSQDYSHMLNFLDGLKKRFPKYKGWINKKREVGYQWALRSANGSLDRCYINLMHGDIDEAEENFNDYIVRMDLSKNSLDFINFSRLCNSLKEEYETPEITERAKELYRQRAYRDIDRRLEDL